jgi:nucleoside-diphosphate-sugar epimerase
MKCVIERLLCKRRYGLTGINKIILGDLQKMYDSELVDWRKLNNKSVLITGAYGMLASYMVYMLIFLNERNPEANIKILAVGRSESKFKARFGSYVDRAYFNMILADISDCSAIYPQADYIVHSASFASPHYYGECPVDVMLPNILGTQLLLKKAADEGIKGFLFVSGSVYGQINKPVFYENDFGGIDCMNIRSCYDESKRAGETLCACYHYQYGVPIKVVRPSHTYGPTLDLRDTRSFSSFVSDAVAGKDIVLKSDGRSKRTYLYISDAIVAYFKILLDAPPGEAYNVGNEETLISMRELAEIVANLSVRRGTKVIFEKRDMTDTYIESPHVDQPTPSTEKLRNLGWKWTMGIEEGFRRTIESFLLNQKNNRPSF